MNVKRTAGRVGVVPPGFPSPGSSDALRKRLGFPIFRGPKRNARLGLPGEGSWRPGLLILAIVTYFAFGLAYHSFLTLSNFEVILLNVSSILIAGVGTMALLISGNVDLSIGSLWAFDAMVVAEVAQSTQGLVLPIVVGVSLGFATGLVNGTLVRYLRINPLIVTLAMNLVWGGAAYTISGGYAVYGFSSSFTNLGNGRIATVPVPAVVAIVIFIVGTGYLWATVGGLHIYAIGGSPHTARLAGIGVNRTTIGLYAVNGLLIGVVAILNVAQTENASPQTGSTFALEVLTAVILGGVAFSGGAGNPFGVNGMRQALNKSGVRFLVGNSEDDATKEVNDLNSFLQRGVGALITIPVSGNAPLVPMLQKAIKAGAYTEGELAGPAQSVVIAFEYKAGYVQGKQLAQWIDSHLHGQADVLYFNPDAVSPLLVPREQGNLAGLRTGGPGIHVVQNIPIIPSVTKGQQDMETALQAHPNINVVFGDDESVLGALRAYQSLHKITDLKYASGFDGSPDANAVIKAGNTPYKINYGFNYGVLGYVTRPDGEALV